MIDHHTLMQNFWEWRAEELATRGYSPGGFLWQIRLIQGSEFIAGSWGHDP